VTRLLLDRSADPNQARTSFEKKKKKKREKLDVPRR